MVDYRFNEGTNSAGEPAAGTQAATEAAPAEVLRRSGGRPKKTTGPSETPAQARVASEESGCTGT